MNINIRKVFHLADKFNVLSHMNKFYFLKQKTKYDINKDYYGILDLNKEAKYPDIKKKYYYLAKLYHPDVNPKEEQKFKLINEAYTVLSDQKIKKIYDGQRSAQQSNKIKKQKVQQEALKNMKNQKKKHKNKVHQQQQEGDEYNQYKNNNNSANFDSSNMESPTSAIFQHQKTTMVKNLFILLGKYFVASIVLTIVFQIVFPPPKFDQYGNPIQLKRRSTQLKKQIINNSKQKAEYIKKQSQGSRFASNSYDLNHLMNISSYPQNVKQLNSQSLIHINLQQKNEIKQQQNNQQIQTQQSKNNNTVNQTLKQN